ncbi:MAG: ParB/RepB/Spo0J family partition protein [Bacillota bacterium]
MNEKRRLGKGLGALIPDSLSASAETTEIKLDKIKPNPFQPRRTFDDEKLSELAASIKEHGVIQAVVVTPSGTEELYLLVAGERRCRAARIAGLTSVPAVVKSFDKSTMLEIALIENLQREDLNPIEEARAYKKLMQEYNYTQEELSKRIGRSRPSIANSLRLLTLPEKILNSLVVGELTPGQARPLLSINDQETQLVFAEKILKDKLSAREAERIVIEEGNEKTSSNKPGAAKVIDPENEELQLQIQRNLGTKVKLKRGKNGGTIEIYYYSEEDLARLIEKLMPGGL